MPNILLLVVDSLRADAVFGHHIPTPTFDSCAHRGAAFHQCICASTTSAASFSSMLTGCYPPKHGMRGEKGQRLPHRVTTMAEMFSDAGYQTHAEVTGHLLPETGILRGFRDLRHRKADDDPFSGWREAVIERIRALADPWFMLLHIWEVHRPYRSPPDFALRTNGEGYEAAVAATDEWLTPIFEAAGLNTIAVITGDHGEALAEGPLRRRMAGRGLALERWWSHLGKGLAPDEHLIRVPLILAGLGVGQASLDEQVRHVDLLPTLADLCGLEPPQGLDGRSLRPLMQDHPMPAEPAYFEAIAEGGGRRLVGARTPDFKLVVKHSGRSVLYRLPDEKRNQYSRHPEVARRLESFIEEISSSEPTAESGSTSDRRGGRRGASTRLGYR